MASISELQNKREALLKQIKAKGGKDSAPNLAKRLRELDDQIKSTRGDEDTKDPSQGLTKAEEKIRKGVEGGKNLSNSLGFDKPLSQLGTDIPEDQKALIESLRQLGDPSSEAFVGKRGQQESDALNTLKGISDEAGSTSPEETLALDSLKSLMSGAGQRSKETSDLLGSLGGDFAKAGERSADTTDIISQAKARAATAGNRSTEMQETLRLMEQGLAGLNATENQALREQGQREVDRKFQSAVDGLQNAARTTGLKSSLRAGTRNARKDAMMAQGDLEQKNLLANVDVKRNAKLDYSDLLGKQEQSEFNRGDTAFNTYGNLVGDAETREGNRRIGAGNVYANALGGAEANEFDQRNRTTNAYAGAVNDFTASRFNRRTNAADAYSGRVNDLANNERGRVNDALGNYGNSIADRNAFFLDSSKVNLGQERADRAAQIQSSLGLAGLAENETARQRALRQGKRKSKKGDGRVAGQTSTLADPNQFGGFRSAADQEYYNSVAGLLG